MDALIDRMKEAATEEAFLQAGHELQRYVTENMMFHERYHPPLHPGGPYLCEGLEDLHGHKIRFETTWLDKP